nr:hypothetical protein [Tanacetum cinerariifolium]
MLNPLWKLLKIDLEIYEAEVKGLSPSSQNIQNIAFVSSKNTDSINESVTASSISAPSIFAASSKAKVSTLPNVDSLSDAVIYHFFASGFSKELGEILVQMEQIPLGLTCPKLNVTIATEEAILLGNADHQGKTGTVLVEVSTLNALVSQCDAVGGYHSSFQAKEEPTNYALMAYASSSSLELDNE